MKIKVIAFDADDTLWDYEIIYQQARPQIINLFRDHHDPEELSKVLNETEISNLAIYGYGVKGFALSVIETLANQLKNPIDGPTLQKLIVLFKDMLDRHLEISPHAESTLIRLSKDYRLMLLTKGELFEQERKIQRSGLAQYFDLIEIISQKTEISYRQVLTKHTIQPEHFLMVGNSLKSDVLPVIAVGGNAIYIPHEHTWVYENLPEEQVTGYVQLDHLGQLPEYLEQFKST